MTLLDALHRRNKNGPPIWLLRQAGRYMPAYQKIRANHALLELFRNQELISEVTLLPLQAFDLDAAIIFSDILIILDGLGIEWEVLDKIGPVIQKPLQMGQALHFISKSPDEAYAPLLGAIQNLKQMLKVPLLGFAGGPFTLASYLIEGKSPQALKKTKRWMYSDPLSFRVLLDKIADAVIVLLSAQIKAGVDAVQLFETHMGELALLEIETFILPPLAKILAALPKNTPTLLFSRHSALAAPALAALNPTALSLDWSVNLSQMRAQFPSLVIQGNLDPALLFGTKKILCEKVQNLLDEMQGDPGYIFNLGHGILPETPFENVAYLVECVKAAAYV